MPRHSPPALGLVFACLLSACKGGPPPDLVRLELPEVVLSSDPVRATVRVRHGGTSSVATEAIDYQVTPPDLVTVAPDGTLSCQKSGDANVAASIQGVSDRKVLRCRLVDRIEIPDLPPLNVGGGPVLVAVRPLAKNGAALGDVPISLSVSNPRVLEVQNTGGDTHALNPLAVGEATVTARAGTKEKKLALRVFRSLNPEAVPLEGGRRLYFGLPEGKYELSLELPAEKLVTVEWRGAPYCAYRSTGRSHRSSCVLQGKGGAVVDNPGFLVSGSTEVSRAGLVIHEVP